MITDVSVSRNHAIQTRQFYLLWGILFINVTAGIGILAQASPMMQDMFHRTPAQAALVVSIISLFNAGGRFLWASGSDYIGRRNTYLVFFVTQFVLFLLIPGLASSSNWVLFQVALFIVFTMYGGGFATIPAFLADIFGPENVGAIHGALLTAWSAAAVAGPVIITELSNRAKRRASRRRGPDSHLRHAAAGAGGTAGDRVRAHADRPAASARHAGRRRTGDPSAVIIRDRAQLRKRRLIDRESRVVGYFETCGSVLNVWKMIITPAPRRAFAVTSIPCQYQVRAGPKLVSFVWKFWAPLANAAGLGSYTVTG